MPSIEHQPETKPLSVLLEGAYRVEGTGKPQATAISGLCVDSRETRPGFLFGAMPGSTTHGAEFAGFAMRMDADGCG